MALSELTHYSNMAITLQLMLVVSTAYIVSGCRCGIPGERDRYCRAEHASIIRVYGNGQINANERVYRTSLIKHLKETVPGYNTVIRNKVYTATSSAACGVLLEPQGIYLIAGGYHDNGYGYRKQYIGLCNVVRQFTSLKQALAFHPYSCNEKHR